MIEGSRRQIRFGAAALAAMVMVGCVSGQTVPTERDTQAPRSTGPGDGHSCGSPGNGSVEVTIWHALGGNAVLDLMEDFTTEMASEVGVRLKLVRIDGEGQLLERLAATPRADWPDAVIVSEQASALLLDSGEFADPERCAGTLIEDLLPAVEAAYTVDGRLVALPYGVSVPVLIYDAVKLERAGISGEELPTTFEDLLEVSRQIRDSRVSTYGLVLSDSCSNYLVEQLTAQRGEHLTRPDAAPVVVDLASRRSEEVFLEMRDAIWDEHVKYIGSNPSGFDDLVALTLPDDGAAMTIHTSAALGEIIFLLQSGNFEGIELGVAPLPGDGPGSLIGGNALWVAESDQPGHEAEVWRAIEWLYAPRQLARLAAATGYVPPTRAAADESLLASRWESYPQLRVAYQQVLDTPAAAASSALIVGPFEDKARVLRGPCDAVFENGAEPSRALTEVSHELNYLITAYSAATGGEPPPTTETSSPAQPTEVAGVVSCASGAPVVGIWVDAVDGGSGFADRRDLPDGSTSFTKLINFGSSYQIHVGCGGTEADWATSYFSHPQTGQNLTFVCEDQTAKRHGWCTVN